jgi:hypothetical protein
VQLRGDLPVSANHAVPDQETVTCVIPGHYRQGRDLVSDMIEVNAGPLAFWVSGRCAYESTFDYSSDDG